MIWESICDTCWYYFDSHRIATSKVSLSYVARNKIRCRNHVCRIILGRSRLVSRSGWLSVACYSLTYRPMKSVKSKRWLYLFVFWFMRNSASTISRNVCRTKSERLNQDKSSFLPILLVYYWLIISQKLN